MALPDGEKLYRTEYRGTREEAEEAAREANARIADGKVFQHDGKTVDEFVAVETE